MSPGVTRGPPCSRGAPGVTSDFRRVLKMIPATNTSRAAVVIQLPWLVMTELSPYGASAMAASTASLYRLNPGSELCGSGRRAMARSPAKITDS